MADNIAANMAIRSMYNWLLSRSSMIILTKCIHCGFFVGDWTSLFDSTNKTIFDIDRTNRQLTKVFDSEFTMHSWTHKSSLGHNILINIDDLHLLRCDSFWRITISPTMKFLCGSLNFCFYCKVTINSFCHRLQNSLLMCWILLHLLRNIDLAYQTHQVEGITTLDLIVKMLLGYCRFTINFFNCFYHHRTRMASNSVNKLLGVSSSRLILCVLIRDENMVLADLIYLSHTPPISQLGFFPTQSNQISCLARNLESSYCPLHLCIFPALFLPQPNCFCYHIELI